MDSGHSVRLVIGDVTFIFDLDQMVSLRKLGNMAPNTLLSAGSTPAVRCVTRMAVHVHEDYAPTA